MLKYWICRTLTKNNNFIIKLFLKNHSENVKQAKIIIRWGSFETHWLFVWESKYLWSYFHKAINSIVEYCWAQHLHGFSPGLLMLIACWWFYWRLHWQSWISYNSQNCILIINLNTTATYVYFRRSRSIRTPLPSSVSLAGVYAAPADRAMLAFCRYRQGELALNSVFRPICMLHL